MYYSRRHLLLTGACFAIWPRGTSAEESENANPAEALIDVHCHVFNASDIPVRGFVQRVALGDEENQRRPVVDADGERAPLPALASILIALLSSSTITAKQELDRLGRSGADAAPELPGVEFETTLAETLTRLLEEPGDAAEALDGSRRDLRRQIIAESGLPPGAEPDSQTLANALLFSDSRIGRYVRWARLLMSSRTKIIGKLEQLYVDPSRPQIFTPALVDFSTWLGGEPRSQLSDQIVLMDALQQRSSIALHAFVPFDPWRMARDRRAGKPDYREWKASGAGDPADLSALGLVQLAIEEMGFVGVKLYPPMGFRPSGNAATNQTYPARAITEFPSDFPLQLDRSLEALYDWCSSAGVPIMAHASNSQGAADGYAERANPKNWKPVLDAYPDLRISLAHFGDSLTGSTLEKTWDKEFGALVATGHPGIYADVSHHSEILPRTGNTDLAKQGKALRRYLDRYDPAAEHIVYGTDWSMLGRIRGHEDYPARFADLLRHAGLGPVARANLFYKNSRHFLGLQQGEKSYDRLRKYYANTGGDFTVIKNIATM